jgi:hypothetical protein
VTNARTRSIRADLLPPEALDLLAWAFHRGLPADPLRPGVPMLVAEIRLDGAVYSILYGGDGFRRHGGAFGALVLARRDDPAWAIVWAGDCAGCPDRGDALLSSLSGSLDATRH